MEALKRSALIAVILLALAGCDYLGLDGYVNQLREFGITHDLADAVSFSQNLVSRPREFDGKVYVLGTRGVFVMDADELSDYQFYPYTVDLGYDPVYDNDRLAPINCYREPATGQVVIMALNYDQGVKFGDTLTLLEGSGDAVYSAASANWVSSSGVDPPVVAIKDPTDVVHYVVTDLFNDFDFQDRLDLWTGPVLPPPSETNTTPVSQYIRNDSFSLHNNGRAVRFSVQAGIPFSGTAQADLTIYSLTTSAADWVGFPMAAFIQVKRDIRHDRPRNGGGEYISSNLAVSTNDDYIMVYGFDDEDDESFLLYDYTGKLIMERDAPDYSLNAELAERGKVFYTSNSRGGVAKYVLD